MSAQICIGVGQPKKKLENLMDPQIIKRYNDDILNEAMQRYGIRKNEIKLLDGFESFMYEFYRPQDGEFILRISHSGRRTP